MGVGPLLLEAWVGVGSLLLEAWGGGSVSIT